MEPQPQEKLLTQVLTPHEREVYQNLLDNLLYDMLDIDTFLENRSFSDTLRILLLIYILICLINDDYIDYIINVANPHANPQCIDLLYFIYSLENITTSNKQNFISRLTTDISNLAFYYSTIEFEDVVNNYTYNNYLSANVSQLIADEITPLIDANRADIIAAINAADNVINKGDAGLAPAATIAAITTNSDYLNAIIAGTGRVQIQAAISAAIAAPDIVADASQLRADIVNRINGNIHPEVPVNAEAAAGAAPHSAAAAIFTAISAVNPDDAAAVANPDDAAAAIVANPNYLNAVITIQNVSTKIAHAAAAIAADADARAAVNAVINNQNAVASYFNDFNAANPNAIPAIVNAITPLITENREQIVQAIQAIHELGEDEPGEDELGEAALSFSSSDLAAYISTKPIYLNAVTATIPEISQAITTAIQQTNPAIAAINTGNYPAAAVIIANAPIYLNAVTATIPNVRDVRVLISNVIDQKNYLINQAATQHNAVVVRNVANAITSVINNSPNVELVIAILNSPIITANPVIASVISAIIINIVAKNRDVAAIARAAIGNIFNDNNAVDDANRAIDAEPNIDIDVDVAIKAAISYVCATHPRLTHLDYANIIAGNHQAVAADVERHIADVRRFAAAAAVPGSLNAIRDALAAAAAAIAASEHATTTAAAIASVRYTTTSVIRDVMATNPDSIFADIFATTNVKAQITQIIKNMIADNSISVYSIIANPERAINYAFKLAQPDQVAGVIAANFDNFFAAAIPANPDAAALAIAITIANPHNIVDFIGSNSVYLNAVIAANPDNFFSAIAAVNHDAAAAIAIAIANPDNIAAFIAANPVYLNAVHAAIAANPDATITAIAANPDAAIAIAIANPNNIAAFIAANHVYLNAAIANPDIAAFIGSNPDIAAIAANPDAAHAAIAAIADNPDAARAAIAAIAANPAAAHAAIVANPVAAITAIAAIIQSNPSDVAHVMVEAIPEAIPEAIVIAFTRLVGPDAAADFIVSNPVYLNAAIAAIAANPDIAVNPDIAHANPDAARAAKFIFDIAHANPDAARAAIAAIAANPAAAIDDVHVAKFIFDTALAAAKAKDADYRYDVNIDEQDDEYQTKGADAVFSAAAFIVKNPICLAAITNPVVKNAIYADYIAANNNGYLNAIKLAIVANPTQAATALAAHNAVADADAAANLDNITALSAAIAANPDAAALSISTNTYYLNAFAENQDNRNVITSFITSNSAAAVSAVSAVEPIERVRDAIAAAATNPNIYKIPAVRAAVISAIDPNLIISVFINIFKNDVINNDENLNQLANNSVVRAAMPPIEAQIVRAAMPPIEAQMEEVLEIEIDKQRQQGAIGDMEIVDMEKNVIKKSKRVDQEDDQEDNQENNKKKSKATPKGTPQGNKRKIKGQGQEEGEGQGPGPAQGPGQGPVQGPGPAQGDHARLQIIPTYSSIVNISDVYLPRIFSVMSQIHEIHPDTGFKLDGTSIQRTSDARFLREYNDILRRYNIGVDVSLADNYQTQSNKDKKKCINLIKNFTGLNIYESKYYFVEPAQDIVGRAGYVYSLELYILNPYEPSFRRFYRNMSQEQVKPVVIEEIRRNKKIMLINVFINKIKELNEDNHDKLTNDELYTLYHRGIDRVGKKTFEDDDDIETEIRLLANRYYADYYAEVRTHQTSPGLPPKTDRSPSGVTFQHSPLDTFDYETFDGGNKKTRKHKTRKHKTGKHKTGKHKTIKHKTGKDKTGKHKTRKHKTGKHKTRKHKTRKHKTGKHKTRKHKTRKHKI